MVDQHKMMQQLVYHEGMRLKYYRDTVGKITVAVGWNVTDRGVGKLNFLLKRTVDSVGRITSAEALHLLALDIKDYEAIVAQRLPAYAKLSEVRQRVCVDMAFNMGFAALEFKQAIAAINVGDWYVAYHQLLASKWAKQVGLRADRLARMLFTGDDYPAFAAVVL